MTISQSTINTNNYLVPAGGNTHAVPVVGQFTAVPYLIDWRNFSIDSFPFSPQGVFIDNSQGAGPLIVNIQPINYKVVCPAGVVSQFQFPAPNGQTCTIVGDGQATVIFVDFPVLPNSGLVQIGGTVDSQIVGVNNGVIVPTQPAVNNGGLPYQVQKITQAVEYHYLSITGAAVSANVVPTIANQNLRKLIFNLSSDATLAAAGRNLLTVTANAVVVYEESVYIPAAALNTASAFKLPTLDFSAFSVPMAAGNLTVSLSNALATGILDINAYFGA